MNLNSSALYNSPRLTRKPLRISADNLAQNIPQIVEPPRISKDSINSFLELHERGTRSRNVPLDFVNKFKKKIDKIPYDSEYEEKYIMNISQMQISIGNTSSMSNKFNSKILTNSIVIILIMTIGMQFFSSSLYYTRETGFSYDLSTISLIYKSQDVVKIKKYYGELISRYQEYSYELLEVRINKVPVYLKPSESASDYRETEIEEYESHEDNISVYMVISHVPNQRLEAFLGICGNFFILMLFLSFNFFFNANINDLIGEPLKRVAFQINRALKSPISYNHGYFYRYKKLIPGTIKPASDMNEIIFLISKLSLWMSYTYGNVPSRYIADTFLMKDGTVLSTPGRSENVILSVLDFKGLFEKIAKKTGGDSTIHINRIMEIIQGTADQFFGATMILGFSKIAIIFELKKTMRKRVSRNHSEMACLAVISILKILVKLHYLRRHSFYLGENDRARNFKDYVSIVLTEGVAFKGLVSSVYKGEFIYTGPVFTAAQHLMKIKKDYKICFMVSDLIYNHLSECIKIQCRLLDSIRMRSTGVMLVYSIDVCTEGFKKIKRDFTLVNGQKIKEFWNYKSWVLENLKNGAKNILFLEDFEIEAILSSNSELRKKFRNAVDLYLIGDWTSAHEAILLCQEIDPKDGPSIFLMKILQQNNFERPYNWRGFREIF